MFWISCIYWTCRYFYKIFFFHYIYIIYIIFFFSLYIIIGPPITSMSEQKAHVNNSEVATGPFIMKTPLLSTYSQQLWVIAKLLTSNNDGNINIKELKN